MKKINLCISFSLLCTTALFTTPTLANSGDYLCPDINEIKNTGLDKSTIFNNKGNYLVSQQNYYNTSYSWIFRVDNIIADNDDDAFNKAESALNSLSGDPKPIYANSYIYCVYNNHYGYSTQVYTQALVKTTATITIKPDHPETWGYINATVSINKKSSIVGNGITVPLTEGSILSLMDVAAMNAHPKIEAACFNIKLTEGSHQLLFELNHDWLIHCQYS